mgnify:CR=1 FL=1
MALSVKRNMWHLALGFCCTTDIGHIQYYINRDGNWEQTDNCCVLFQVISFPYGLSVPAINPIISIPMYEPKPNVKR